MSTTESDPTFQCEQCGRIMKWSPAIAGKRGKCKCGATLEVPNTIEPPAKEYELGALDIPLQDVDETTQGMQPVEVRAPAPLSYATGTPQVVAAGSGESSRKIYVLGGILVLGFALVLLIIFMTARPRAGSSSQASSASPAGGTTASTAAPSPNTNDGSGNSAGTTATAPPAAAAAPPPPPPPPPFREVETERDRYVWHRVHGGNPAIRSLKDWKTSPDYNDEDAALSQFLDHLTALGAIGITVDTTEAKHGVRHVYVELPLTEQPRDAVFGAVKDFLSKNPQAKIGNDMPNTDRFLEITLGQFDRFAPGATPPAPQ